MIRSNYKNRLEFPFKRALDPGRKGLRGFALVMRMRVHNLLRPPK